MPDDHHSHGHDHSHDDHDHSHGGGGHDHSNDLTPALQSTLYSQIDFDKIVTLNEGESGSGMAVVKKTWDERLDPKPELISDADEQILMTVPFTGQCTLHTLLLHSPPTPTAPATIHLHRNRPNLDFPTATDLKATQTVHLPPPSSSSTTASSSGILELPLNRALFNGTTSVTLFVESNHSQGEEDQTEITYVGFRGTWMRLNREPVSVLYEAAANPSDHKVIQGLGVGVGQGMQGR